MSTQPQYWTNPLQNQFDVEIESIREANGNFYVRLRENVIKPASGGQAGDKGHLVISGEIYEFVDTILYDGQIVLVMNNIPNSDEEGIKLQIDMPWRKAIMRNHTSEHIFVGAMKKRYPELHLGRIWIDGVHGTITLEGKELLLNEVLEVESIVNEIIHDEVDVNTEVVTADRVDETIRAREGVTSKNDDIRLVNIGEFDSSACSGIHVPNTREIGVFKIVNVKTQEGNTHIEFISGQKAIENLCEIYNFALSRKYDYPYEIEQLGAILDKSKKLEESYHEVIEKIIQLLREGPTKEQLGNTTFWYEYLPGCDIGTLRHMIKEMKLEEPSVTLFLTTGKKVNIILWTKKMPNDAAFYIAEIVKELGGKGGGSSDAFTGGFSEVDDSRALFHTLVERIREKIQTT